MDNGLITKENTIKMGASGNPNAARIAALQERKQSIEENLAKRNQELRVLCIQEAELTGVMPPEVPLQPGESPPIFRRRIGTSFQIPQNLINNLDNEDESITSLELNLQVQANMAEAALSLANEGHVSKTVRRQHMAQYQYHKRQYNSIEEKLTFLKTRAQMAQQLQIPLQHKQKKKPRPVEQEDLQSEPFEKSVFRHSMRSLQHSLSGESSIDSQSLNHQKVGYRNSEGNQHIDFTQPLIRPDDSMISGIYRLSLSGYKTYMERKEHHIMGSSANFMASHPNLNIYQHQSMQQLAYSQGATCHTLPLSSQHMPQSMHAYPMYPQCSPTLHHSQSMHDYPKYTMGNMRQSSSSNSSLAGSYTKSYCSAMYSASPQYHNVDPLRTLNPHQIQPHQQYEQDVMTTGLGGHWKRTESGELVWCNSSPSDSWQRDKRFGSLDRRRNKRLHKRTSPLIDSKSATISTVMAYQEPARPISKPQQIARNSQDARQLVRTQSLGSVGAQTVDSVWPSDDNSSCGSDAHSINEINANTRKPKQKEWFETSLDGPAPVPTRPHSTVSTVASAILSISPEEKYIEPSPQQLTPSPQLPKPPLEIPAESYPQQSPTVHEPNMELFNNNIPKNGTLIQAGQCKPYHEETKPFEMSDFYKYSTKFKKSPNKQVESVKPFNPQWSRQNLSQTFEEESSKTYQSPQIKHHSNNNFERSTEMESTSCSINTSLDLSQLTSNIAENFSAEMNAWYHNQEKQVDNSERDDRSTRSTATLV